MDPDDAFGALNIWLDPEMEKKVGGHDIELGRYGVPFRSAISPHPCFLERPFLYWFSEV